jgi:predicted phage terminase large subunit-like protein
VTLHLKVRLHDEGPALWPGYIPLGELDDAKRDLGTPIFETMYQGRRGGLAGKLVKPEWLTYFRGWPPGHTMMAVDPAISEKTSADETAIVVGNIVHEGDGRGRVYLRFVHHARMGLKETSRVIGEIAEYYRPVAIGIEAVAYQTALIQFVESEHPGLPFEPVKPDRDKLSRFLGLAALYEFGRVLHHPDMQASAYEWQLTHVPDARHDDMVDAACYLAQMGGISAGSVTGERPEGAR